MTCGCVYVWLFGRRANSGNWVCERRQAWGLMLKDCFVVLPPFFGGGCREQRIDGEVKGGGGSKVRWGWVRQLGEIKVGLTFSTASTPAESPPVPHLPFFSPSFLLPSLRRISELGFPQLLSEEAIMMFWNTKAFHAQTSAWFGVKERAGLPAKLALPLSLSLCLSDPLLSFSPPLSAQSPHSLTRSDSASSSWGSRHSSLLPPPHPQGLGCDPSCQYCSVFDLRGRRMCVGGRGCVHHLVERSSLLRWCKPQTVEKLSHLLKTLIGTEVSFD